MKKRLYPALLVFLLIVSLLPVSGLAETEGMARINGYTSNYPSGQSNKMYVTLESDRVVAPGVTEQSVFLNDESGNNQVAGYMTTADVKSGLVKIKASYKGFYNGTDSSKWGVTGWGMQTMRDQAAAYEVSTGEHVVAATNGDYFNMQTGQPLGVLIMNGVNCNPDNVANEPYFAILKDGTAVIRDAGTSVADVAEAISSPFYLVKNGKNQRSKSETDLIPGNSIGIDDQGRVRTFLADGRQEPYSRGITMYELAEFWIAQGVKNVLYLDGGGSATLLNDSTESSGSDHLALINSPSDGYERTVSSGLLFVTTAKAQSGVFDRAVIYSSADSIPRGGSVQFDAQAIDADGYDLPCSFTWSLDAASSDMGSIDSNGLFVSNGKTGSVTVNLGYDGKTAAGKTINVTSDEPSNGFTGFVSAGGGQKYFINGKAMTGWFMLGKELHHTDSGAILHKTTTTDTRTCLGNGYIQGRCECGAKKNGQALWSLGHHWNESHVCTRCGAVGTDIQKVSVPAMKFYSYTGRQITPGVNNVTYNGKTLDFRSSRSGKDGYLSYGENINVGYGTMTVEGRGNFYGTLEMKFYIIPGSMGNISASNISADAATLTWDAAPGADNYIVEQNVDGTWTTVASTSETSCRVTGLQAGTDYEFRAAWQEKIDKTYTTTVNGRPTVTLTTPMGIECTDANGRTFAMTSESSGNFFLLPSGTDLTKLTISTADGSSVTISGSNGSAKTGEAFDLTKLASLKDGAYTLTVKIGSSGMTVKVMVGDSIGTMYLTSSDVQNAGREYVDAVKGNSTTGTMTLVKADGKTVVYNGELTQLKSRGNSSFFYSPKKAYQIKLASKSDLLGNGQKGKTWVLLANYMDATSFHDKLFKDLAGEMGMYGTPDCEWVNLYYDGEYRGVYLISEKASIGSTTVDITDMEDAYKDANANYGDNETTATATNAYGNEYIYTEGLTEPEDITGGYLIELNGTRGIDEASGFKTSRMYNNKNYTFNVKSPEFAGKAAMDFISSYFQEFEDAVYAQDADGNFTGLNAKTGKYFYEYCDMESLVKMFMLQQIAGSPDAFYASLYFYKDAGGKLYAGPLWDMDLSLGSGMDADITSNNYFVTAHRYLTDALIQIPAFKQALEDYLQEFSSLIDNIISTRIDGYADILDANVAMNHVIWDFVRSGNPKSATHLYADDTTYDSLVSAAKTWLRNRLAFTKTIVTHEHSYKLTGQKDVSCTVSGYTGNMACTKCGAVKEYGRSLQPPGHQIVTINAKEATETETGYTGDTVCTVCNEVLSKGEVIPMKGTLTFTDVSESSYCASAVVWALGKNITKGYDSTHFLPDNPCTRANVVTFLWRAKGEPEPQSSENPFTDLEENAYYYKAVLWAVENGIATGYSDGSFRPNATCTRAHVVTFLWRYEGKPAAESEVSLNDLEGLNSDFTAAIKWAAEKGITTGYSDGSFRPNSGCTRAHVVTFLYRDLAK